MRHHHQIRMGKKGKGNWWTWIGYGCLALSCVGCESKTGSGAAIGAGAGAATGALITGGGVGGTLIGGAVGAAGGALIGSALDQGEREEVERQSPRTLRKIDNGEPLSVKDIEAMSRAGVEDSVIISQIDKSKSIFYLTSDEIIELKKSGVSERVINYMIHTGD